MRSHFDERMQPLFPPWSDAVLRLFLVAASAVTVGTPVSMILWARTPYVTRENDPLEQPVAFDHRHHVRDDGIDCLYCHGDAEKSKFAGVPPTSVCMSCHSQVWQESTRLAPVRASWFADEPIRWRRVYQLPQFVYFDHSAHVSHGVGCVECHGRVDLMGQVYAVSPLTMAWCLDCHRDPDPHLRPPEQVTNMEWDPPQPRRAAGAAVRASLGVDPPVTCSACHR
jgi:hypothetical protein